MKSSTRRKAIQLCEEIFEKCGGPGGTPGPCPSGRGKPKPAAKPSGSEAGKPAGDPKVSGAAALKAMPKGTKVVGKKATWEVHKRGGPEVSAAFFDTVKQLKKQGFAKDGKAKWKGIYRVQNYRHPDGHTAMAALGGRFDDVAKIELNLA